MSEVRFHGVQSHNAKGRFRATQETEPVVLRVCGGGYHGNFDGTKLPFVRFDVRARDRVYSIEIPLEVAQQISGELSVAVEQARKKAS